MPITIFLDILILAETKLCKDDSMENVRNSLSNWNVFNRYDAEDGVQHMGLLLLTSKKSSIVDQFKSITHQTAKRNDKLQIQGLIIRLTNDLNFGFVYCRSSPTNSEIKAVRKYFDECQFLLGDFNLSHRVKEDCLKIENLCEENKISFLKEITRAMSNNQLD